MSSVSLQDSQLQFYDAIEYFTTDTESDDDSEQDSDADGADTSAANRTIKAAPAIVPGKKINEKFTKKYKFYNLISLKPKIYLRKYVIKISIFVIKFCFWFLLI